MRLLLFAGAALLGSRWGAAYQRGTLDVKNDVVLPPGRRAFEIAPMDVDA